MQCSWPWMALPLGSQQPGSSPVALPILCLHHLLGLERGTTESSAYPFEAPAQSNHYQVLSDPMGAARHMTAPGCREPWEEQLCPCGSSMPCEGGSRP